MTMGGPAYMQVGNETYSLMITEEDMEKRKTERERQKRLSQETNRRRKALEDRKKLAVEREARKRSLELSKRKQRQTEATERYQRSHIGIKQDRRAKFHGGMKSIPSLDNVLQQLRSGSTEIVYPFQANANSEFSTQLTDHVKSQFELELEEQKQRVLEQQKQQSMQELNNELKAETVSVTPARPYSGTMYNANVNSYPTYQQQEMPKSDYQYSNVDIMSGRTAYSNDQFNEPVGLAGRLSRLFIGQENQYNEHGEPVQFEKREKSNKQFTSKSDTLVPSCGKSTKESDNDPPSSHQSNKVEDSLDTGFDDQDSLHGNSPVASPVFNNHLTSFQRKYFSDVEVALKQNAPGNGTTSQRPTNIVRQEQQQSESKPSENQSTTYYPATSPVNRAPPNYYVKSYRPWSTTESSNVPSDWPASKPIITRPLSAAPTVQTAAQIETAESKRAVSSQSQQPASKPWSAPVMHVSIPTSMQFVSNYATATINQQSTVDSKITEKEPMNNRWMTKTTATPITTFLSKTQSTLPESTPVKQPEQFSRQNMIQKQKLAAAVLTEASPLPVPTDRQRVSFSPPEDEKPIAESTPIKEKGTPPSKVKGILRKVSKYGGKSSYPAYRAGVVARNQWVESVNNSPYQTANAKLRNTEVRDSLEVTKVEEKKPGKSVMWNEIQYNDGTSVSIATPGIIIKHEAPVSPAPVAKNASPRGGKSAKGKQAKFKPKPATPAKGGKKGGKQNRKFKPSKEVALPMEPRPPATKKKQLVMATAINFSVPSGDYPELNESASNNQGQRHVSWTSKEQEVTMDTLKSSGSSENLDSPPLVGPTIRNGNQVTIHMMKQDASNGKAIEIDEEQPSLDKTPTDQEIGWLWGKVRSCLAQRPSSRVQQQPNNFLRKTASDTNRFGGAARRSAWNAAVTPTIQQQQASIVSIDGGLLAPDNMLVKPMRNRRLVRPTSAVQLSSKVPSGANDSYGAFMRRQALLQQRRHKHYMSRGVKPDMMRNFANYPSPKPSYNAPHPSPSSAGSKEHMSDSTTAFLLAETLAEQNLSEDQIIHAMDSLQKRTREAQKHGKQVMASALSQEEQRLLASLERLNTRLREVEETVSKNPQSSSGPFFNVPQHQIPVYKHHVQRSVSADARYQRSRLRY